MRFRSLISLRQELEQRWLNGEAPVLRRTAEREFFIDEVPSGVFTYEDGFSDTPSTGPRKSLRFVLSIAAAGATTAMFIWANTLTVFHKPESASQITQNPTDAVAATQATDCPLNLEELSVLNGDEQEIGGRTVVLKRDIVIGGVREQVVSISCGSRIMEQRIRFVLSETGWKAESATPVGSHFPERYSN